jgi:recombination protein RecA
MGDVQDIAAQLNAVFGEGTVRLGSDPSLVVRYWPTGVLPVDVLLGGGIPAGRFTEIFGDYSTLKSYIGLRCIAEVQRLGGTTALVDTEHAFDPDWAHRLAVDTSALLLQHPPNGEAAVKITEVLIRNKIDLIVWDSVAATLPKAYQEATPGDSASEAPARLAALMSKACARLNAANSSTAILAINQTRVNVGMTYGGTRDVTPGGKALNYYASYRVRCSKAGKITVPIKQDDGEKMVDGKETVAVKIRASLEKSKLSAPHREALFIFDLMTGTTDDLGYLVAQGLERGLVVAPNSRYTIPEAMDGSVHGQEKFKTWLAENPEVVTWLRDQILEPSLTASPGKPTAPVKKTASRTKRRPSKS